MGRSKGKGKKPTASTYDDLGSGEEEKIPAQKKRGRPLKTLKDEIDEEVAEKIVEEEDSEKATNGVFNKEMSNSTAAENGKKRKRTSQAKEELDLVKEENGIKTRSTTENESSRLNGFRHNGNRRKNKPRRAAEAGVECR